LAPGQRGKQKILRILLYILAETKISIYRAISEIVSWKSGNFGTFFPQKSFT
jgi:hypothetical protein